MPSRLHARSAPALVFGLIASMLGAVLLLVGCTSASEPDLLAEKDLDGLLARDIIERLDTMPVAERDEHLMASVRPDELLLSTSDGSEAALPMPEDEFYLSIAPYIETTHDCYYHSLTTCLGELANQDVTVTVVDNATGEAVFDERLTTYDNGFVGIWLPRDLEATLTVESDGRSASTAISTAGSEQPTCITTLQLV